MEPTTVQPTSPTPETPETLAPAPITDLAVLDISAKGEIPQRFVPLHPATGKPIDSMWIDYLSSEGATGVQKRREIENHRAMRRAAKRRERGAEPQILSIEEWEAETVEQLVALATGWHIVWDGAELPFTEENVRWLLGRLTWLRVQSKEFVDDLGEYLGN